MTAFIKTLPPKQSTQFYTSIQFAAALGITNTAINRAYNKHGHVYGIVPIKLNRILRWPRAAVEHVIANGYTPPAESDPK